MRKSIEIDLLLVSFYVSMQDQIRHFPLARARVPKNLKCFNSHFQSTICFAVLGASLPAQLEISAKLTDSWHLHTIALAPSHSHLPPF